MQCPVQPETVGHFPGAIGLDDNGWDTSAFRASRAQLRSFLKKGKESAMRYCITAIQTRGANYWLVRRQ